MEETRILQTPYSLYRNAFGTLGKVPIYESQDSAEADGLFVAVSDLDVTPAAIVQTESRGKVRAFEIKRIAEQMYTRSILGITDEELFQDFTNERRPFYVVAPMFEDVAEAVVYSGRIGRRKIHQIGIEDLDFTGKMRNFHITLAVPYNIIPFERNPLEIGRAG